MRWPETASITLDSLQKTMADNRGRELCVGGKPISSLRVVDLKVELEKRSLPKSGSKKDLLERLRLVNIVFNLN
jgi:hypothetical protein